MKQLSGLTDCNGEHNEEIGQCNKRDEAHVGRALERWWKLQELKELKSNAMIVEFWLDRYYHIV